MDRRNGFWFVRWGRELLKGRHLRNVGFLTSGTAVAAGLAFVKGIVVARVLGAEAFGVVTLVASIPVVVHAFFDAQTGKAGVKYLAEFGVRGEAERVRAMARLGYTLDAVVAVLVTAVVWLAAPWAAETFVGDPAVAYLIVWYAVGFLPRALESTSRAILDTQSRFRLSAVLDAATMAIRTIAVVALALAGYGVAGVVLGEVLGFAARGLIYGYVAHSVFTAAWERTWLTARWGALRGYGRELARFMGMNLVGATIALIPKQLDILLLGYFRDPGEVGIYKLGKSVAAVASNLVAPFETVLYPHVARLWSERDFAALRHEIRQKGIFLGGVLGATTLLAIPFVPIVLPFVAGPEYVPSIPVAQIFIALAALALLAYWLRPLLLTMGEVGFLAVRPAFIAAAMLAGFLVVVPSSGYLGAAWVMFGAQALVGVPLGWGYAVWKFRRVVADRAKPAVTP